MTFFPFSSTMFIFIGNESLSSFIWRLYRFQSSFVYGRLNLMMENTVIVSSMRRRIMSFTISMLFSSSDDSMI
jgi:hypothetical protein